MKLHALMFAVALAAGTTAYAMSPSDSTTAPAATQGSGAAMNGSSDTHKAAKMHRKVAKKAMHRREHHASMRHEEHMASARRHDMHRRGMDERTLGAGPSVDLNSQSREHRMDQAYADWQNRARR